MCKLADSHGEVYAHSSRPSHSRIWEDSRSQSTHPGKTLSGLNLVCTLPLFRKRVKSNLAYLSVWNTLCLVRLKLWVRNGNVKLASTWMLWWSGSFRRVRELWITGQQTKFTLYWYAFYIIWQHLERGNGPSPSEAHWFVLDSVCQTSKVSSCFLLGSLNTHNGHIVLMKRIWSAKSRVVVSRLHRGCCCHVSI